MWDTQVRSGEALLEWGASALLAAAIGWATMALTGLLPAGAVAMAATLALGVAAMSAISQRGHLLFRLHNKRIASPEVIAFLNQLLVHHDRRHLVVVMDQAPPHTSKKTMGYIEEQSRLHVFHLPKYSPDWNPDEKVWNHLKHQELASHQAKTKAELKQLTRRKLQSMAKRPTLLRGLFFRCCVADLFA